MYVCICKAITEQQVLDELDNGARNFKEVSKQLGVGSQCGICGKRTKALIKEYQNSQADMSLAYAVG